MFKEKLSDVERTLNFTNLVEVEAGGQLDLKFGGILFEGKVNVENTKYIGFNYIDCTENNVTVEEKCTILRYHDLGF